MFQQHGLLIEIHARGLYRFPYLDENELQEKQLHEIKEQAKILQATSRADLDHFLFLDVLTTFVSYLTYIIAQKS